MENKYKRRYQVLMHRCLACEQISQEMFLLLTSLTEEEVSLWFVNKVREVKLFVDTLGMIIEYQAAKQLGCIANMCSLRQKLGIELSLWSDVLALEVIPRNLSSTELGLLVLKLQEPRQAALWALRLDVTIPELSLSVSSSCRVRDLLAYISKKMHVIFRIIKQE